MRSFGDGERTQQLMRLTKPFSEGITVTHSQGFSPYSAPAKTGKLLYEIVIRWRRCVFEQSSKRRCPRSQGYVAAFGRSNVLGRPSVLAHQLHDFAVSTCDKIKTLRYVGEQTVGAVFHPVRSIGKSTAAAISQSVKGAVTKQAIKMCRIRAPVAGKIFALNV